MTRQNDHTFQFLDRRVRAKVDQSHDLGPNHLRQEKVENQIDFQGRPRNQVQFKQDVV